MSSEFEDNLSPESEAPGLSTGAKVLLVILGVFGILCVACCGGVLWFANQMDMRESTDAAEIAKLRADIVDIEIPKRFEPQQLVELDAVFFDADMVFYESSDHTDNMLGLIQVQSRYRFFSKEEFAKELKQNETRSHLKDATTETRNYDVGGTDISVVFSHGTIQEGEGVPADQVGKKWYSVNSVIPGDDRLTMLIMAGPEEEFDEEEIETMIKSIRFPHQH